MPCLALSHTNMTVTEWRGRLLLDVSPEHLADRMCSAQTGDRAAYESLLRDSVRFIRALARVHGVPAEKIAGVVDGTLGSVHGARHTYDPSHSYQDWLEAIAMLHIRHTLRFHRKLPRRSWRTRE